MEFHRPLAMASPEGCSRSEEGRRKVWASDQRSDVAFLQAEEFFERQI